MTSDYSGYTAGDELMLKTLAPVDRPLHHAHIGESVRLTKPSLGEE